MQSNDAEIVIIGAGIMGLSSAFYLSEFGHEVVIFERRGIGREASGSNAGTLAIQNKPYPLIPLAKGGIQTWKELAKQISGVHVKQPGGFRVAETTEDAIKLQEDLVEQNRQGLGVEHLSPKEIKSVAPYLSTELKGANYCAWDGYVDLLAANPQIALAVQQRGARIMPHTEVTHIDFHQDGTISVASETCSYRCQKLLITAGVWSRNVAALLGIKLPIELRINQMIVTARVAPVMFHMITHVRGHLTMKQLDIGSVLIGGGWQGKGGLENDAKELSYESIVGNVDVAVRVVPQLAGVTAIRCWSGFEGKADDGLPIIGSFPDHRNIFIATSCKGGYVAGPYVGKLMAQTMDGKATDIDLTPFSPARFA